MAQPIQYENTVIDGFEMKKFLLPYGHEKLELELEDAHFAGVLESRLNGYRPRFSATELVKDSLEHPIGSVRLRDLSKGKSKIVVISSDHTRPVPSKITMPLILDEIRKGNPQADITILIATGLHRRTTPEELRGKFGEAIVSREKIVIHDCDDRENLVDLGKLPSGGPLLVNRMAYEADLLVAEGFIEPHFFAGFSGGRKSVLPGIAGRESVLYNHNAQFIADPDANTGNLENNPIHRDMLYAAKIAHLAFIVNVVVNDRHEPIFCVSGNAQRAHEKGCDFLRQYCQIPRVPCDIAVTTNGGYPLDQNIYQSVKGMTAAERCVKENGVIVMLAKANDGDGGENFRAHFRDCPDVNRMLRDFLATDPEKTRIDQWQSQIFARVLKKARVIYVSSCPDALVRQFQMIPAHGLTEAMQCAVSLVAKTDYRVAVIPDGVSVIVS